MSEKKYAIEDSAGLVGREVEVRDLVNPKILYEMRIILLEGATLDESPLDVILDVFLDTTEEEREKDPQLVRALSGFTRVHLTEEDIQITIDREKPVDFEQLALDVVESYRGALLEGAGTFLTDEQVGEARENGLPTALGLYWVMTEDHNEDWFIVATTEGKACSIHEEMEGYDEGDAAAELVVDIPPDKQKGVGVGWPSDELLTELGGKFLPRVPDELEAMREQAGSGGRIIQFGDKVFCEGDIVSNINAEVNPREASELQ
jgi:hypothetical protein